MAVSDYIGLLIALVALLGMILGFFGMFQCFYLIGTKRFDVIYEKMTGNDISWADSGYKVWEFWDVTDDFFWKYKEMLNDPNSNIHKLTKKERKAMRRNGWCSWIGGSMFVIGGAYCYFFWHP